MGGDILYRRVPDRTSIPGVGEQEIYTEVWVSLSRYLIEWRIMVGLLLAALILDSYEIGRSGFDLQ